MGNLISNLTSMDFCRPSTWWQQGWSVRAA